MSLSLREFLVHRAEHGLNYLLREVEPLSEAEAFRYRDPNWVPHKYGIGQDGSIAGIVFHVVAWKALTLSLFTAGSGWEDLPDFESITTPNGDDWQAILSWLREVGAEWNGALAKVTDEELGDLRPWVGNPIPVWQFVIEMIDHDVQHASQVEYLRQRMRVEKEG